MSGRIKAARGAVAQRAMPGTGYAGDPGLFGFLGKVAKGALGVATQMLPGPVGMIARGGYKKIFGSKTPAIQMLRGGGVVAGGTRYSQAKLAQYAQLAAPNPRQQAALQAAGMMGPGVSAGAERYQGVRGGIQMDGRGTAMMAGPGASCPVGYRPNKTGYWVTSPQGTPSYVSPGERCVKARRRNPLNPRAWDRAYSRLKSAKRWQKKMGTITFREVCK